MKRVLVFGSDAWSYTRPITKMFYDLWPATHEIFCDTSTDVGRIAFDHAERLGFKVKEKWRVTKWDHAYIFIWDDEPSSELPNADVVHAYISRRRDPRTQAPPPET